MQRIDFKDLEQEIVRHLTNHTKGAAATATWTQVRRHDNGVAIVAGAVIALLKVRHYRVVRPSLVTTRDARTGHGAPAMPGHWGVDEPEPGEEPRS